MNTRSCALVMRIPSRPDHGGLPWMRLGVHAARLDVDMRDLKPDEARGLNCVQREHSLYSDTRLLSRIGEWNF